MNKPPIAEGRKLEERSIRPWKRPEVRKVSAGDAETGDGGASDGTFSHS